jgi:ribosomal protein S18 acetylase RimI-like enzyme
VVREDYQGRGIASFLLDILEKIARENDYKGFSATVLRENQPMIHIFKKKYPNAKTSASSGSDIQILMDFEDVKPEKK